jgi:CheY-like chemotaxis protein
MKRKLNSILLIDDDFDCNYFHERLLQRADCANKIYCVNDGREALDFLLSLIDGEYPNPAIIFLDINMPRMNGWEFLEEYKKLTEFQKAKIVLILLTSSLNPDDKDKGLNNCDVKGFYNKFLDKETLQEILIENFPEYF